MAHSNVLLVESFYTAFQGRDGAAMGACFAPTIRFRDPVFVLEGWRVRAMWRMLCERGVDLRIEARNVQADDTRGSAHWEAWYTFRGTGRSVHNVIEASFVFSGGRIVEHRDRFDLHRWAAQALGLKGRLFGWAPPVQRAIRGQAARALDEFIRKQGSPRPRLDRRRVAAWGWGKYVDSSMPTPEQPPHSAGGSMPLQNTELMAASSDPGVGRALEALRSLLITGEQLEAYVIQRRLFALIHRRTIVGATTGRFIAIHRALFGGFDPHDVRWQDLHDVSLHVGIFGATLSITVRSNTDLASAQAGGRTLTYAGLRKPNAQAVYRICQSNAQAWREKRRVRDLEELRAKSGGIQLSGGGGGPGAQFADTDGRSPTARLARAKEMLASGLLNDAEFEQIKARILAEL